MSHVLHSLQMYVARHLSNKHASFWWILVSFCWQQMLCIAWNYISQLKVSTSSWTWRWECLVIQALELASLAAIPDASWWETIMKVDSLNINIEVKSNMLDNRWQHLSIVSIALFSFHATNIDLWSINCVQFTRVTHVTNSTVSEWRHENSWILISHTSGRLSDKLFTEMPCGYRNALPKTYLALLLCTLNSNQIMSINCEDGCQVVE